ncbi:uncharacterized protein LOC116212549 [Punica granatum]|uniref:Uncharacterized protein n=2 Tax=Punica granatum TaxID=22663 RepID=A0A2I0HQ43_PUNGR|nr:uncharacterized protein LOC116212549 [Punica granatum]PKI33600.1 hypothetical protein CRG98_046011 [Punica granatum]
MVCTAEGSGERDISERAAASMAMGPERSRPLHNFSLPRLKWGRQLHMRCVKIDSLAGFRAPWTALGPDISPTRSVSGEERRRAGDAVVPKLGIGGVIDCDSEIREVREKYLSDLKEEICKMTDSYLRQGAVSGEAADQGKEDNLVRPWNLRTRRAACKAPFGGPDGGKAGATPSPQRSEGGNSNGNGFMLKTGLRSGVEKKREERAKFFPTLKRKEVEDDFMMMTGHRPPRKPKKRPRAVQKQLDMLVPGLWLTEVTVDSYKVPEIPDNAKR